MPRCLDRLPAASGNAGGSGQPRPVYGGIGFDFPETVDDVLAILDSQKVDDSLNVLHLLTALAYHLRREHASFETIADIVRQSEPLSVEIIKAAGFPRGESPTVLAALLRLGTRRIQRLVADHSFRQIHRTFRSQSPQDINRNNVWTFSYSHALLAQRCDDACGGGGDVHLPALLERTGIIIFNQFFFEPYAELLLAKPRERSRYEWEDEHLGYNSIEVGARYLEHLGIPDLAGKVRTQFVPQSDADEIRYFARYLTAAKVPIFRDDVTYDPAIIARVAERLGADFERTAVDYLRTAFRGGRAA